MPVFLNNKSQNRRETAGFSYGTRDRFPRSPRGSFSRFGLRRTRASFISVYHNSGRVNIFFAGISCRKCRKKHPVRVLLTV